MPKPLKYSSYILTIKKHWEYWLNYSDDPISKLYWEIWHIELPTIF